MNPITQIELNAHFRDLEQQVATARQTQGSAFGWVRMLWRERLPARPKDLKAATPLDPAPAR